MSIREAVREVRQGYAQRISRPGRWVVWLDGGQVKTQILTSPIGIQR